MARLTLLLTLLTLALPAAARARPADEAAALATERYYQSYGTDPAPAATAAPAITVAEHDGPSWLGAAAIGAGLALLGAYGARTVRPRGVGA